MGMIEQLKFRLRRGLGILDLEEKIDHLNHQIQASIELLLDKEKRKLIQEFVSKSKPGSLLSCCINHVDLLAPVEMLHLYPHCLQPRDEQKLNYLVETHCSDWLCAKLQPGDVVLDIGAAFGVITIPLSQAVGSEGHVYAFEPAIKTQKFLQQVIDLNKLKNVTLVHSAISDKPGSAEFIEYTSENELSWASDTSTLASDSNPHLENYLRYNVDVTTIDDYVMAAGIEPKAIKIDIEGFELYALYGAKNTLDKFSPYLCIDIHKDVKTGESAILGVEPYLVDKGYQIQVDGHTIYCTPKTT
ncbi:MAG: FkbM family methyltransferase [Moorea sp. SIO2B7]|nr:FkbM family methyltransferase [Moorena sp. SIO2B7]